MNATRASAGMTLTDTLATIVAIVLLGVVLAPIAKGQQQDSRLVGSLTNLRLILAARDAYSIDHAGMMPIRGSRYTNGTLGGYDTWHVGGKNSHIEWQTRYNGLFDESAYSRPLNVYLYPNVNIPVPAAYVNTGSGSTWNFWTGHPTPEDRLSLDLPIFRSPGDRTSYQSSWPNPGPRSGYDDVGTSYMVNMSWYFQPDLQQFSMPQRMLPGTQRMSAIAGTKHSTRFIWMADQTMELAFHGAPGSVRPGEFGGANRSAVGYLDGRAAYIEIIPQTPITEAYTLHIP
jgi:type II secretory pathway pseudopilin PulG